jgi:hypothetical protein
MPYETPHVAAGRSNKIVAEHLRISEDAVKGHVRNILSKLNASDRTHAVTIALRRGFLELQRTLAAISTPQSASVLSSDRSIGARLVRSTP